MRPVEVRYAQLSQGTASKPPTRTRRITHFVLNGLTLLVVGVCVAALAIDVPWAELTHTRPRSALEGATPVPVHVLLLLASVLVSVWSTLPTLALIAALLTLATTLSIAERLPDYMAWVIVLCSAGHSGLFAHAESSGEDATNAQRAVDRTLGGFSDLMALVLCPLACAAASVYAFTIRTCPLGTAITLLALQCTSCALFAACIYKGRSVFWVPCAWQTQAAVTAVLRLAAATR